MALLRVFVLLGIALAATALAADNAKPAFAFQQVDYFHRWSQGTQHEFTPAKQEDLDRWTDMITINVYPSVDDGEKMAGTGHSEPNAKRESLGERPEQRPLRATKRRVC